MNEMSNPGYGRLPPPYFAKGDFRGAPPYKGAKGGKGFYPKGGKGYAGL